MIRSTASQASRRDANPAPDCWPRIGARIEDGVVIVRVLKDGENPSSTIKRAVLIAEPCEQFPTLVQAIHQTAARIANSLRQQAPCVVVEVRI